MKTLFWFFVGFVLLSLTSSSSAAQSSDSLQIVDAKLGKDVQDREIVEEGASFMVNDKVYLWMKVAGGTGDTLTIQWRQGDHEYTTNLGIGGSPWRTWSYKTAAWPGSWTVSVMDSQGNTLKEMKFTVAEPEKK